MKKGEMIIKAEEVEAFRVAAARKDESFLLYLKMTYQGADLKMIIESDASTLTLHHAFSAGVAIGADLSGLPAPITPSIMRGRNRRA